MENNTASAAEDMAAQANGMASAQDSADAAQSPEELAAYNDRLMAKNHALAVALQRAGRELNKAKSQLAQLVQPPMTFAVMVRLDSSHTDEQGVRHASAEVISGARRMIVPVAANVNATRLAAGCTVLLNENMVLVDQRDVDGLGMVRRIAQILDGGRLVVADTSGNVSVVRRGSALSQIALSVGDRVSVDPSGRLALDELPNEDATELVLEETPNVTFDDIGGLDTQIERIRDAVQLPFLHRALFERYDLNPPKGVLLYGPPGNGKTLIAKAVAHALAEGSGTGSGVFLSVKGPELLNKFVGESERLIRIIFKRARERAESGRPVIVFIDEMDSLLRTRGSGVSSDVETTIVPQFLAELDGVEQLDNVIVIGASNRVDMIDPAVLRPGRLDVKIRVDRPGAAQAKQIVRHYLTDDLPLDPDMDADALAGILVSDIYAREERRHIADLRDEQGRWSPLYMADIVSGAMLRNIIDRAKTHAVKQSIESGSDIRLDAQLLGAAVEEEYGESADSVLDADAQQWSRINGVAGGRVVALRPAGVARS
jgi:proteasome-associated ATPase